MFELVLWVKDKGSNTLRRVTKEFNSAGAMAAFYNSMPGHNIEREIDSLYREPVQNRKKK